MSAQSTQAARFSDNDVREHLHRRSAAEVAENDVLRFLSGTRPTKKKHVVGLARMAHGSVRVLNEATDEGREVVKSVAPALCSRGAATSATSATTRSDAVAMFDNRAASSSSSVAASPAAASSNSGANAGATSVGSTTAPECHPLCSRNLVFAGSARPVEPAEWYYAVPVLLVVARDDGAAPLVSSRGRVTRRVAGRRYGVVLLRIACETLPRTPGCLVGFETAGDGSVCVRVEPQERLLGTVPLFRGSFSNAFEEKMFVAEQFRGRRF